MTQSGISRAHVTHWMREALHFCAAKCCSSSVKAALRALAEGDCSACEYLRYGLARSVGEYLGSADSTVVAVYTYEPEYAIGWDGPVPEGGTSSPGMHLVVHVSHRGPDLVGLLTEVEAVLAHERGKLGCSRAKAPCFGLDAGIADDADVQRRAGFGALLSSPWVQPVEVWHR